VIICSIFNRLILPPNTPVFCSMLFAPQPP
jgi:hypothetical protein